MSAPGLKLLVNGIQFEHAFSSAVFEAPDSEVTSTPKRPMKWQTTSLGRLWKWDWLPILKDQWFELLKNQVRKCGIWAISQDMSRPNSVRWCKSQRHLSRCGLLMSSNVYYWLLWTPTKGSKGRPHTVPTFQAESMKSHGSSASPAVRLTVSCISSMINLEL